MHFNTTSALVWGNSSWAFFWSAHSDCCWEQPWWWISEGQWTRANTDTIIFILYKPLKPSLDFFLWLLLGPEARSSHLGVLGLWFPFFFLKPLSDLGPPLLRHKHSPRLFWFISCGGLGHRAWAPLGYLWTGRFSIGAHLAANECAVPRSRVEVVWSDPPTHNSVRS